MDGFDGLGDLFTGLAEGLGALIELAVRFVFWFVELIVHLFSSAAASRMKKRRAEKNEQSRAKLARAKERLARFRNSKAKRIAKFIKLALLLVGAFALWWVLTTDRAESEKHSSPTPGSRAQKPDSETKSKWSFSFSLKKKEDPKPAEEKPEEENPKSRWKLPFTKSDKADEQKKEPSDERK